MRRTVNIWVLIGALFCVLVAFFCMSSSLSRSIGELDDAYGQSKARLAELQKDQAALKDTLASDAYIENQARTVYGYMMPDEIRLVISNPETLYGEEGVPSR